MKINHSNGVLEIPYFRPEDSGLYECVAENSKGRSIAKGRLVFQSKVKYWLKYTWAKWLKYLLDDN